MVSELPLADVSVTGEFALHFHREIPLIAGENHTIR
jgi:hypothetical protein